MEREGKTFNTQRERRREAWERRGVENARQPTANQGAESGLKIAIPDGKYVSSKENGEPTNGQPLLLLLLRLNGRSNSWLLPSNQPNASSTLNAHNHPQGKLILQAQETHKIRSLGSGPR